MRSTKNHEEVKIQKLILLKQTLKHYSLTLAISLKNHFNFDKKNFLIRLFITFQTNNLIENNWNRATKILNI